MAKVQAIMSAFYDDPAEDRYIRRIANRFEELNNIPVRILTEDDVAGIELTYPHFARYHAWSLVPEDTERLIYMDTDIIPIKPLPQLPDEDFAAVTDSDKINDDAKKQWPLMRHVKRYFNSGFFIANRKLEPVFQEVLARQTTANNAAWPWFRDQTLLNLEVQMAAKAGKISVRILPREWNHLALLDDELVEDAYMLHVSGIHPAMKLRFINYILDAFCPPGVQDE